jgi:hypothetical protein
LGKPDLINFQSRNPNSHSRQFAGVAWGIFSRERIHDRDFMIAAFNRHNAEGNSREEMAAMTASHPDSGAGFDMKRLQESLKSRLGRT